MKLIFPENILRQHVAVLGQTGKGELKASEELFN
jgi:hypothetical protein